MTDFFLHNQIFASLKYTHHLKQKKNVNFYALYIIQVIEFDYNIDIQLIENSEIKTK